MARTNEDHGRLLQSRRSSSSDDIEAFEPPDVNNPSPYTLVLDSTSDTGSTFNEYKRSEARESQRFNKPSWNPGCTLRQIRYTVGLLVVTLILFMTYLLLAKGKETVLPKWAPKTQQWAKPKDFNIVGLVFYGRPEYVSILDCYLKKNLAINGGYLDEVHWMTNTDKHFDLKYLDYLVSTSEYYKKIVINELSYDNAWQHAVQNDTMYIKIDDDIVYIHEDAVSRLVHTKLSHPESFDVAGNIVNSPLANWFHARTGAVHPYLPEPQPPPDFNTTKDLQTWRASELPTWKGHADDEYDFGTKKDGQNEIEIGQPGGPTYEGHRWLPMENTSANFMKTPMAKSEYNAWGRAWTQWPMAAQQQYSLFENLEKDQMSRYWFGNEEGIWNMQYDRYNLNFLAVWGRDIAANPSGHDDEQDYTVEIPKRLKRPLLIDTHAIVAHYSFSPQHALKHTDLLNRYRAYANEMVCAADKQLKPMELHYK